MRSVCPRMRAWLVILLCLGLAACGGEEEKGAPAASGGGGGGEAGLAAPLTFKLTGGDAFRSDRITVRPDGTAQVTTRKGENPAKLTREELATVSDQLDDAELAKIPEDSLTDPPLPDALAYSFVYEGREVSTDSGSLPDRLKPLIGTFIKLVDRYGTK